MPDGVFARTAAGALHFHSNCWLAALDVEEVLATVEPRIARLLERRARAPHHGDGSASNVWAEDAPVLTGLAAASVQGARTAGEGRHAWQEDEVTVEIADDQLVLRGERKEE